MQPSQPTHWTAHNTLTGQQSQPPAETLLKALEAYETHHTLPGKALDLGSGSGIDTLALLQQGWQVTAVDKDAASIALLQQRAPNSQLQCLHSSFETMQLPHTYTLINASFSLPFCPPAAFNDMWQKIYNALLPGGYFCGHLFGPKDSWRTRPDVTTHTQEALDALFTGFTMVWKKEIEKDAPTVNNTIKHWHIYAVCAQKL